MTSTSRARNADNIGNQAGGWTLTWQGGSTNQIPGDTILDGIRGAARGDVTYSKDASRADRPQRRTASSWSARRRTPRASATSAVRGGASTPVTNGVLRPPQTMQLNDADKAAVDKVCSEAQACTVIVVSGRPMMIDPAQLQQDRRARRGMAAGQRGRAAWPTRCSARKPFTGKLPVTWPRTLDQEPINVGDDDYDPLYPFGYGLRSRKHGH